MFGAFNIGKDYDKSKYAYSGYGMPFDWKGEWSFGNNFAKNIIILGVDNSSLSHTDNH